jgi:hypothetical protein
MGAKFGQLVFKVELPQDSESRLRGVSDKRLEEMGGRGITEQRFNIIRVFRFIALR